MDLSVLNVLMSTTSSGAQVADALSGQPSVANPAVINKEKNTVSSGEAFMAVLDQVRNGKAEKTSETIFNTISSKAENSANAKKIGSNDNASKNVRVLKLSIKRTKPSETHKQAETPQQTMTPTENNRQKIPALENSTAPAVENEEASDISEQLGASVLTLPSADVTQEIVTADAAMPKDEIEIEGKELDIGAASMISAILPAQQPVANKNSDESVISNAMPLKADISENHIQAAAKEQDTPQDAAPEQAEAKTPVENTVTFEKNIHGAGKEADIKASDKTLNLADKASDIKEQETALDIETSAEKLHEIPQEMLDHVTKAIKGEAKLSESPKANTQNTFINTNAEDAGASESAQTHTSENGTRYQAEQLAAKLPTDTKVSVQVQQTNVAPQVISFEQNTQVKKEKTNSREITASETDSIDFIETDTVVKAETVQKTETAKETKADNTASLSRNEAQQQMNMAVAAQTSSIQMEQQTLTGAMKSASGVETVTALNGQSNAPPTAGQALFNAPNETLKGKAVTGETPAPAHKPANELVDQIKVNISKAVKQGLDKIEIVLRPKELGSIRVRLEVDSDGNLKMSVSASRAETLDMLQKDINLLRQSLADSGLNTNEESFTFNYHGEQAGQSEQNERHASHQQASNGQENTQADNETELTEALIASGWSSGRHALNIRV